MIYIIYANRNTHENQGLSYVFNDFSKFYNAFGVRFTLKYHQIWQKFGEEVKKKSLLNVCLFPINSFSLIIFKTNPQKKIRYLQQQLFLHDTEKLKLNFLFL